MLPTTMLISLHPNRLTPYKNITLGVIISTKLIFHVLLSPIGPTTLYGHFLYESSHSPKPWNYILGSPCMRITKISYLSCIKLGLPLNTKPFFKKKHCNKVLGSSTKMIINYFIFLLTPHIHCELLLDLPRILSLKSRTLNLANFEHSHLCPSPTILNTPISWVTQSFIKTFTSLPIKLLYQTQLQEQHVAIICYNFDKKFHQGHKCSSNNVLLLLTN
ncbi:hypothetical protein CR513_05268, partial [Mucuna pruriens]